jgi:hypothetical protein
MNLKKKQMTLLGFLCLGKDTSTEIKRQKESTGE